MLQRLTGEDFAHADEGATQWSAHEQPKEQTWVVDFEKRVIGYTSADATGREIAHYGIDPPDGKTPGSANGKIPVTAHPIAWLETAYRFEQVASIENRLLTDVSLQQPRQIESASVALSVSRKWSVPVDEHVAVDQRLGCSGQFPAETREHVR